MEPESTEAGLELASTGVGLVPGPESIGLDSESVKAGLTRIHCYEPVN